MNSASTQKKVKNGVKPKIATKKVMPTQNKIVAKQITNESTVTKVKVESLVKETKAETAKTSKKKSTVKTDIATKAEKETKKNVETETKTKKTLEIKHTSAEGKLPGSKDTHSSFNPSPDA